MLGRLKSQSPQADAALAMVRCTDIYQGLDRLLGMKLPYVILDNVEQYHIMNMEDRWIEGKPIYKYDDGVGFEYAYQGVVYRIQSSTSKQGEVMFFNTGSVGVV